VGYGRLDRPTPPDFLYQFFHEDHDRISGIFIKGQGVTKRVPAQAAIAGLADGERDAAV
jgi:hypothetical protein